jgi:hypothetical protein
MMHAKSWFKKYARVGPGGWRCACCGPAPGKEKKQARRRWARSMRRQIVKEFVLDE